MRVWDGGEVGGMGMGIGFTGSGLRYTSHLKDHLVGMVERCWRYGLDTSLRTQWL